LQNNTPFNRMSLGEIEVAFKWAIDNGYTFSKAEKPAGEFKR